MNTKRNSQDTETLNELSKYMTQGPSIEYPPRKQTKKEWNDIIDTRVGLVNLERLMMAAKHKQNFEVTENKLKLPNLWNRENAQILERAAKHILQHSQEGDSIQIMADKVVLMCKYLSDSELVTNIDINLFTRALDNVFMNYQGQRFENTLASIMNRLRSLNIQVQRRPPPQASEEVDGGFYKKNTEDQLKQGNLSN